MTTDFSVAQRGDRVVARVVDHGRRNLVHQQRPGPAAQRPGRAADRHPAPGPAFDDGQSGLELWVDPARFEVLRFAVTKGEAGERGTVRWLPRSPAVPAGPPSDGAGRG